MYNILKLQIVYFFWMKIIQLINGGLNPILCVSVSVVKNVERKRMVIFTKFSAVKNEKR
jgi:hypothetical protein